ncbi:MAG: YceI family protein [Verrucomicrobiia bacterium]
MKKSFSLLVSSTLLVLVLGCSDPADNVPAAVVTETVKETPNESAAVGEKPDQAAPAPAAPAAAAAAEGGKSFVLGGDSKIDFLASKAVGGETPGGFKKFVGQLSVVDGNLVATGSKIVIDMESTWTKSEKLTAHLKNEDFFNAPKFPTSTFEATEILASEDIYKISGNLTMHGITKPISFPAAVQVSDDKVTLKSKFSINRYDFDMKYKGQADNVIRERVTLTIDVTATPGAADFSAL